jgi:sugar/nucleoside kinase (ribokinase family)
MARAAGAKIVLHLGTFEIVRTYRDELFSLLKKFGPIDLLIGNEDEAAELQGRDPTSSAVPPPEAGLSHMLQYANIAVVTMGERGCLYASRADEGGKPRARLAITQGVKVVDTTGAGDLFTAGFVYGLLRNMPLEECAYQGALTAAAVCQVRAGKILLDCTFLLPLQSPATFFPCQLTFLITTLL